WSNQWGNLWAFTYQNFLDCRRGSRSLTPMAAWRYNGGTVSQPGEPQYVDGREISSELFPVLGVTLSRCRAFRPEDDRPGAAPARGWYRNRPNWRRLAAVWLSCTRKPTGAADSFRRRFVRKWKMCSPHCGFFWARLVWCC